MSYIDYLCARVLIRSGKLFLIIYFKEIILWGEKGMFINVQ